MADKALQTIVDQVNVFARQYQAVIDLAAVVDSVAKIDQLRAEADAALVAKRAECDQAQADLDGLRAQIAANQDANAKVVAQGRGLEADAKAHADAIVAQAQAQAASILEDARNQAADVIAKSADAQASLDAVNEQVAGGEVAVKAAQDELAVIQGKIDDAKAVIAKMMGA